MFRVLQGSFKSVSRKFQECFNGVFSGFQRYLKDTQREGSLLVFHGCFNEVSKKFQECFKGISRKFQGGLKGVFTGFQGYLNEI